MNTFALFLLQGQPPGGITGLLGPLVPMILVFAVFYFLILVPQRRRQKELQEMVRNLKAGDRIVTSGGIIATITAVRDTSLLVRSADKSILEISRASVAGMHGVEEEKK